MEDLIKQAIELNTPIILNPKDARYKELFKIYKQLTGSKERCTSCVFYSVMNYFSDLLNNNIYSGFRTMTNKTYKVADAYETGLHFNGRRYYLSEISDELIELMIKSGSFKLGTHFELISEAEVDEQGKEVVVVGDKTAEIQEPLPVVSDEQDS
jgi:hypothetical protein